MCIIQVQSPQPPRFPKPTQSSGPPVFNLSCSCSSSIASVSFRSCSKSQTSALPLPLPSASSSLLSASLSSSCHPPFSNNSLPVSSFFRRASSSAAFLLSLSSFHFLNVSSVTGV